MHVARREGRKEPRHAFRAPFDFAGAKSFGEIYIVVVQEKRLKIWLGSSVVRHVK